MITPSTIQVFDGMYAAMESNLPNIYNVQARAKHCVDVAREIFGVVSLLHGDIQVEKHDRFMVGVSFYCGSFEISLDLNPPDGYVVTIGWAGVLKIYKAKRYFSQLHADEVIAFITKISAEQAEHLVPTEGGGTYV